MAIPKLTPEKLDLKRLQELKNENDIEREKQIPRHKPITFEEIMGIKSIY